MLWAGRVYFTELCSAATKWCLDGCYKNKRFVNIFFIVSSNFPAVNMSTWFSEQIGIKKSSTCRYWFIQRGGFSVEQSGANIQKVSLVFTDYLYHGTIIRTGITCEKIPLWKCIEFSTALKWLDINKEQKFFLLPDHQLVENLKAYQKLLVSKIKVIKANL